MAVVVHGYTPALPLGRSAVDGLVVCRFYGPVVYAACCWVFGETNPIAQEETFLLTFAVCCLQYAYVIFIVLKHRFYPSTIDSVRQSLDRSLNRGALSYRWGELVNRQARNQWLEPLLDEVAPYIQMQVGDLAAFLEVLEK